GAGRAALGLVRGLVRRGGSLGAFTLRGFCLGLLLGVLRRARFLTGRFTAGRLLGRSLGAFSLGGGRLIGGFLVRSSSSPVTVLLTGLLLTGLALRGGFGHGHVRR